MSLFHLLLVSAIQGLTEFLPISSSGHLALIPILTGLRDQGLAIDVAAHTGSIGAVLLYFRADFAKIIAGVVELAHGDSRSAGARLALGLIFATIPVVLAGAAIKLSGFDVHMRKLEVIGIATIAFGILLLWSDRSGKQVKSVSDWTVRDALIFGFWQIAALIPGASRSGVTITAARFCGYVRQDAVRISMLMSLPVIIAATTLSFFELAASGHGMTLTQAGLVVVFSFSAALVSLYFLMGMLRWFSFTPFVIYRFILGGALLTLAWL